MNYEDWSTRKLKRKYLRQVKKVWDHIQYGLSPATERGKLRSYAAELNRRGWEF